MARFEPATGRYVYVTVEGVEYRAYFEEAGQGIPLLLQHTAGSDGRQWRHLLSDPEITRDFRVVAYDLPYHGKSLPPEGARWWESEYRLRRTFFIEFVQALARALDLDRPIFMGCSMGGHLAADLARDCPEFFRAIIGLEAGLASPGYHLDLYDHPRITNDSKAALMMSLTGPESPEPSRRETVWMYAQGAPPVFKGDLWYYSVEHDLRSDSNIDTRGTPLYLLTGEYDWATTPEMSEALARLFPGARYQTMKGLGHFPMVENPEAFRAYLLPILNDIRHRAPASARTT